jgi:hypothetical protein
MRCLLVRAAERNRGDCSLIKSGRSIVSFADRKVWSQTLSVGVMFHNVRPANPMVGERSRIRTRSPRFAVIACKFRKCGRGPV